jgi:hypothetical protein
MEDGCRTGLDRENRVLGRYRGDGYKTSVSHTDTEKTTLIGMYDTATNCTETGLQRSCGMFSIDLYFLGGTTGQHHIAGSNVHNAL